MYAGTTLLKDSGRLVGVHQKIDRAARHDLAKRLPKNIKFPSIKDILYFEGNNGPDGIKRRGNGSDEPWHFIDPKNPGDKALLSMANDHIHNLTIALTENNTVKASYEASWLAHAVVDGLTPAHHYPLGDKIEELWGKSHEHRKSFKNKLVIKGENLKDTISKNWEYIGADGVFTAHFIFEGGVASAIATAKFKKCGPTKKDFERLEQVGFETIFLESVAKIHALQMYEEFGETGWTVKLANQTKKVLIPEMIKIVTLAWYQPIVNIKGQIN